MAIYDPITRQRVEIIGRYPVQDHSFAGMSRRKIKGEFRFCLCRYIEAQEGGFPVGHERDNDINSLVADEGAVEIHRAYDAAPQLPAGERIS